VHSLWRCSLKQLEPASQGSRLSLGVKQHQRVEGSVQLVSCTTARASALPSLGPKGTTLLAVWGDMVPQVCAEADDNEIEGMLTNTSQAHVRF
jgi:hypothetical protein